MTNAMSRKARAALQGVPEESLRFMAFRGAGKPLCSSGPRCCGMTPVPSHISVEEGRALLREALGGEGFNFTLRKGKGIITISGAMHRWPRWGDRDTVLIVLLPKKVTVFGCGQPFRAASVSDGIAIALAAGCDLTEIRIEES